MLKAQELFRSLAKKHKTPKQVQDFILSLEYNKEPNGETLRSAYQAIQHRTAHCMEATFIAAALLEHNNYPPLMASIESKDNLDHVLFVFKEKGKWGAISHSRDDGLRGRAPKFRSIRDLVWSYYDQYIDLTGKIKAYQLANLNDTKSDWRYSDKNVWKAEQYLIDLKHKPLVSSITRYKKAFNYYKENGSSPSSGKYWW